MRYFEITFANHLEDWRWMYLLAKDFHDAMLHALLRTRSGERVHKIEYRTQEEMDAIYKHKGACWNTETAA